MTIHASLSVEVIRCYREGKTYSKMDPYDGCAQITYLPPRAAMITGMQGRWSRHDMTDLMRHVHGLGIGWLLAERGPGHSLPWGEVVQDTDGPGDGLWRIDLIELFGADPQMLTPIIQSPTERNDD